MNKYVDVAVIGLAIALAGCSEEPAGTQMAAMAIESDVIESAPRPGMDQAILRSEAGTILYDELLEESLAIYREEQVSNTEKVLWFRLGNQHGKAYFRLSLNNKQWSLYRTTY